LYLGKTALVTGASSGIGEEFVRQLAAAKASVILVARSKDKLEALAKEVSEKHNIDTHVIVSDLCSPDGVRNLVAKIAEAGLRVDILVNNAGFGTYGKFEEIDGQREHDELMLNVVALVDLTHAFVPAMLTAGEGAIVNVASIAGHQPVPYMAVYAATKAFVLSFSEALWYECKDRGVKVLSLDPGNTATNFHDVASLPVFGGQQTPEQVVKVGLRALADGRSSVISGFTNWVASGFLPRIFPREVVTKMAGSLMKPKS
jgi:short-subunit dehydrogenase